MTEWIQYPDLEIMVYLGILDNKNFHRENEFNAKITAILVVNMDYLDNYLYFVLSHRQLWLSIFGSDRIFSLRLLRFSVRLSTIEIFTENCVISEVAITALSQIFF